MSDNKWAITPLGGVGGVGNACFLIQYGGISVVVDCGLDPQVFHESARIDSKSPFVIPPPRLDILDRAITDGRETYYGLITHGHLDHVGAVGELLKRGIEGERLMMSSWTGKLLRRNAQNLGVPIPDNSPPWKTIRERDRSITNKLVINENGLRAYIFPLNHSTHGAFGVSFHNGKKIVYLTDFKFYGYTRNIPDGQGSFRDGRAWFDGILDEIRGKTTGVDCLLLDVMNSDMEGFTPPEEEVLKNLGGIVDEAPGRVFVSVISSNFQRIEEIVKMCRRKGKKIAFVGGSMKSAYDMLQDRFSLFAHEAEGKKNEYRPSVIYKDRELQRELRNFLGIVHPDRADVILISGTQGEENSAATRFAEGTLLVYGKSCETRPSDWFTVSGRVIPGNESALQSTVLKLAGHCQKVILHEGERAKLGITGFANIVEKFVHVSGHGQLGDMERVLEKLNPGVVIPIHAPWDRVELFEKMFGRRYNIQRLDVGQTLEI